MLIKLTLAPKMSKMLQPKLTQKDTYDIHYAIPIQMFLFACLIPLLKALNLYRKSYEVFCFVAEGFVR